MSSAAINKPSGLSAAFAAAPVDIPKGHAQDLGKHGFNDARMLPTPPHSISPTLPPQSFHPAHDRQDTPSSGDGARLTPPSHTDADVDLSGGQRLSSAALEALGNNRITPAYLAQHHLPELLLEQGPLAIRYILSHLAQTVPGFSRIAPAKARRIVVAALEGKFKVDITVEYEKVGWGRWDARRKGEPRKRRESMLGNGLDALQEEGEEWEAQYNSKGALQIPSFNRTRQRGGAADRDYSHSYDSAMSGMDNSYDEMDAMSLDGDEHDGSSYSHSESDMDISETTEEQDWAASDAAGRWEWDMPFSASPMTERKDGSASFSHSRSRLSASKSPNLRPQPNSFGSLSIPNGTAKAYHNDITSLNSIAQSVPTNFNKPATAPVFDNQVTLQEQEAVKALLAMGTSVP